MQEEQTSGNDCEAQLDEAAAECDAAMEEMYGCREVCLPTASSTNPSVIRRLAKLQH